MLLHMYILYIQYIRHVDKNSSSSFYHIILSFNICVRIIRVCFSAHFDMYVKLVLRTTIYPIEVPGRQMLLLGVIALYY